MTVRKFIKYNVLNINGQVTDKEEELKLRILEKSGNYLVHKDIIRHQITKKQKTSSAKTRSEVRGGGRKPWRQKGTGQARAGSNRSPLWKGGGVIFGPKPKKVTSKINKKERRLALQTLLYNKRDSLLIVDNLENIIEIPKTKTFCELCKKFKINLNKKVLVVVNKKVSSLKLSTRNLKNVELISAENLNTLNLLQAKQILVTTNAVKIIKEIYCG